MSTHVRHYPVISLNFHRFFRPPSGVSFKLFAMNDVVDEIAARARGDMSTHVVAARPAKSSRSVNRRAMRGRAMRWRWLLPAPCIFGGLMLFLDCYGQRDRAGPAPVIVVLGAAVNAGGVPGPSLRARTLHAVALYRRGVAPYLLFTGGVGTFAPAESQAAALLARRHGVPQSAILREDTSTSTWENIEQATRICRAHGWSRVVVVSDAYHLWRARRNFAAMGIEALPSPCERAAPLLRLRMTAREVLSVTRDFLAGRYAAT